MSDSPDSLQARIFDAWARAMLAHRVLVLLLVGVITVLLGWRAATLPIVTTLTDLLPEDTPGLTSYWEARDRFGGDESVFLGLLADDHFTDAGVARLTKLTETLQAHPFVERVISPVTLDEVRPDPDDPEGGLLVAPFVRDGRPPKEIGEAMLGDDDLKGSVISADGRMVMVMAQLVPNTQELADSPALKREIERRVKGFPGLDQFAGTEGAGPRRLEIAKQVATVELMAAAEEAGYATQQIHAGGFSVILHFLLGQGARNMQVLFPFTALMIFLALLFLMRRPVDIVLPLLAVGPAVIWAMGLGGMIFDRLSIISTISPVMVLVVGVSDVVHLVTQFRHELSRGREREEAIRVAFRQVGAACMLTSLTTFIGFGAMWFLPLPPSRELGVFAGLGVVSAFILSFVLVPVLLSYTKAAPAPAPSGDAEDGEDTEEIGADLTRALTWLARFITPRAPAITVVGFICTALVVAAVLQVEVENGLVRKIGKDHPVRQSLGRMADALGGAAQLELLIDSGKPDGLKDPKMLAGLQEVLRRARLEDKVGGTTSYVQLIERIHSILGPAEDPKHPGVASLPDSRELVAQYLLLFEMQGGDDLTPLLDDSLRYARGAIRIGDLTAEEGIALGDKVDGWGAQLLPEGASVETNGLGLLAARFGPRAKVSALQGFATAMVLIAILLGLLFRSVKVGVLSLVPNVLPVAFGVTVVAVMYEQVDLDTLNFLAICLGIAVDDTIHFLARFRIERDKGLQREAAVHATLLEAGHGIVRTSLVLVAGFGVMILGDYMPISSGGLLLCLTLAAAVVVDLTLVPAMAQLGMLESGSAGGSQNISRAGGRGRVADADADAEPEPSLSTPALTTTEP